MSCLACGNAIRIDTLKQLLSTKPLVLCSRCEPNLMKNPLEAIYKKNDWTLQIIERLDRGDMVLSDIFREDLKKALIKKGATKSNIKIIEPNKGSPYPWLEILVDDILAGFTVNKAPLQDGFLYIAVEKQENKDNQIALLE